MSRFLATRLWQGVISILGASFIIFVISRLAGDPITLLVPPDAPAAMVEEIRRSMGLDRSIPVQYGIFLSNVASGDFGTSYQWREPALSLVLARLPATMQLASAAFLFSLSLAIPVGVLSAVYRGSWIDRLGKLLAILGQASPPFWVAILLILVFSLKLGWLPAFGRGDWRNLVLPAIALGWYPVAAQTRILRSAMLDVMDSEYIKLGRALGTPQSRLIWKYALRNAAIPLVTVMGVYFASMFSGAFVIEVIFAWPGVGRMTVDAVFARDFPVVQAGVFLSSIMFVCSNLLVDISYGLIDPRTRTPAAS